MADLEAALAVWEHGRAADACDAKDSAAPADIPGALGACKAPDPPLVEGAAPRDRGLVPDASAAGDSAAPAALRGVSGAVQAARAPLADAAIATPHEDRHALGAPAEGSAAPAADPPGRFGDCKAAIDVIGLADMGALPVSGVKGGAQGTAHGGVCCVSEVDVGGLAAIWEDDLPLAGMDSSLGTGSWLDMDLAFADPAEGACPTLTLATSIGAPVHASVPAPSNSASEDDVGADSEEFGGEEQDEDFAPRRSETQAARRAAGGAGTAGGAGRPQKRRARAISVRRAPKRRAKAGGSNGGGADALLPKLLPLEGLVALGRRSAHKAPAASVDQGPAAHKVCALSNLHAHRCQNCD